MSQSSVRSATAVAPSNIALVKYWGKRDAGLNLPVAGSLSMTLSGLETRTTTTYDPSRTGESLRLDGHAASDGATAKLRPVLDRVRHAVGRDGHFAIDSANNFPTGAGLASSASGLAALALSAADAAGWDATPSELSEAARLGSGSASRSIFGGFVEWARGERPDGRDSVAKPLFAEGYWPLRMLVVVVEDKSKKTSSTSGMVRTAATSPYFPAWVESVDPDIATCRAAIEARDFDRLVEVAESSCLKMHASMMTSNPALIYWKSSTLAVLDTLRQLRTDGVPCGFTIDAGPNVKVLLPPGDDDTVERALSELDPVKRILRSGPGPGAARVVDGSLQYVGGEPQP